MPTLQEPRRHLILAGLLVVALAARADPPAAPSLPTFQATSVVLDNGMTVVAHRDATSPRVAMNLLVRAGAADDPAGASGAAHLLEHMMFEGSQAAPGERWERALAEAGVSTNAWTDHDHTSFQAIMPPGALERAIFLEADRMAGPALDRHRLEREREVVRQERAAALDSPRGQAMATLARILTPPPHPYGRPLLGEAGRDPTGAPWDSLDNVSAEVLQRFFRDRYAPERSSMVLAGDLDPAEAIAMAERHLGALPRRQAGPRDEAAPPEPFQSEERRYMEADLASSVLYLAWRTVPSGHRDAAALELAAHLLSSGRGSHLDEGLLHRRELARSVNVWAEHRRLAGTFVVSATTDRGLEEVLARVDAVMGAMARSGPRLRELTRARAAWRGVFLRALEPLERRAALMNQCALATGDPNCLSSWIRALDAVAPGDVGRAMREHLSPERRLLLSVVPRGGEPLQRSLPVEPSPPLQRDDPVAAQGAPSPGPHPELTASTPEGGAIPPYSLLHEVRPPEVLAAEVGNLGVWIVDRPGLPLAQLDLTLLHPPGSLEPGVSLGRRFMAATLQSGVGGMSGVALEHRVDELGGLLAVESGPLRTTLRLQVPSDRLEDGVDVLARLALEPRFQRREVRARARSWRDAFARAHLSPGRLLQMAEARAVYRSPHPLGDLPGAADYGALNRRSARALHRELVRSGRPLLVAAGSIDPARLLPLLEPLGSALAGDQGTPGVPQADLPPRGEPAVVLLDDPGSSLVRLVVSLPADGWGSNDLPLAWLVAYALGGDVGSRLGRALRGRRGYTYGVDAHVQAWPGHGRLRITTTLGAERAAHGAWLIQEQLRVAALAPDDGGFTDQELDIARAALLMEAAGDLDTAARLAVSLGEHLTMGGGEDGWRRAHERLARASHHELRQAASRLCRPEHATWIIMGDRAMLEPELEAQGLFPTNIWSPWRVVLGLGG